MPGYGEGTISVVVTYDPLALCGPVSGKCELKTLDAVAASRVACAGPMLSAGGRALLD